MKSHQFSDAQIVASWKKNAQPWTSAVREGLIASRKLVTDQAIIDAVLSRSPYTVLDIGCGEGWLVRELVAKGVDAIGVDVIPEFIDAAQCAAAGDFRTISYEEIASGKLSVSVDTVVCNFSMLGKEAVEGVFNSVPSLLNSKGSFIVQTLHPLIACGNLPYQDGWREGSWDGFGDEFTDPAPWYFRTLESWIRLFTCKGLRLCEVLEPFHPETRKPASVIFIGEITGNSHLDACSDEP